MKCKNCGEKLALEILDLGFSPPSNSFLNPRETQEMFYRLNVFLCEKCLLVQVPEYKNAKEIFSKNYVYFSSYSKLWVAHAKNYAEMIAEKLHLGAHSQVIEIAANDGYLLQFFNALNIPNIGVEPTLGTANAARKKGIKIICDFFSAKLAEDLPKADLIIGNNVIAHIPQIRDFVRGVKIALKDGGVANFEFPHILNLIKYNQFDTIYHEHFYYYSLHSIMDLFAREGLYIYDVDEINTHGGSLRIYASKQNIAQSKNIKKVLLDEKKAHLDSALGYQNLQKNANKIKFDFLSLLLKIKSQNKRIAGFGATAKGNTLLNFCGIKDDLISFVVDSNPHKQNLLLPGSHIKVLDKSALKKMRPDFIWIGAWNIKDEIISEVNALFAESSVDSAKGGGKMQIHNRHPKGFNYLNFAFLAQNLASFTRDSAIDIFNAESVLDSAKVA
ncbi:methyltransferase domain-containing protein [Helicobacter sp. 23-1044]